MKHAGYIEMFLLYQGQNFPEGNFLKNILKGGQFMLEVLLFLLGFMVGIVSFLVYLIVRSVGTLRVDQSDPTEQPYLFLELDKPVESVINEKYVLFRVIKKNFISQD